MFWEIEFSVLNYSLQRSFHLWVIFADLNFHEFSIFTIVFHSPLCVHRFNTERTNWYFHFSNNFFFHSNQNPIFKRNIMQWNIVIVITFSYKYTVLSQGLIPIFLFARNSFGIQFTLRRNGVWFTRHSACLNCS